MIHGDFVLRSGICEAVQCFYITRMMCTGQNREGTASGLVSPASCFSDNDSNDDGRQWNKPQTLL